MPEIAFNGKFLSAAPTGVHRVAEEIIRAVDALIAEESGVKATILHPANIRRELPLLVTPHRRVGLATGPLWEQSDLPRAAGDRLLINLCNLGPVVARGGEGRVTIREHRHALTVLVMNGVQRSLRVQFDPGIRRLLHDLGRVDGAHIHRRRRVQHQFSFSIHPTPHALLCWSITWVFLSKRSRHAPV